QHPNIVSVFDWGEANGTYFIVMEYVEGHTLADTIRDEGRLHPDRAAEITSDIAAALGFAHRNRVVHRDVKPGNVLITRDGGVKVADFGIARALSDSSDQNLTKTGSVMGTATYFSPEQARGAPVDPRSDLYSLGVVLYEMTTGNPPFAGDSAVAIAYKHVQENPMPPRRVDPSLPETLEAITLKCLAKNPANRYPTAQDLRADLRRYLDGSRIMAEPVLAPPVDPGATNVMAPTGYDQTALVPGPAGYQADGYDDYDDYDEYADEEEPQRSKWFLAALVLLLLVLAGLLFLLASNFGGGEEPVEQVTVPHVIGQQLEAATTTLEAEGFEVTPVFETSDRPENEVTASDPPAGEEADLGSTVTLTVSSGPEPVVVPNVVNMTEPEARQALTAVNLTATTVQEENAEVEEGLVFEQDPPADQEVPPGTAVTIKVSSGAGTIEVPNVAGQSQDDARNALAGAGFTSVTASQEASDDVPSGTVIRTSPTAGESVSPDTTITIVVSSGAGSVPVPNVETLTRDNAVTALENAGLKADVQEQDVPDAGQDGIVIRQSPAPGQQVERGETVTIFVGKYREPELPLDPGGDG
ncbi:MAG: serine/threonine protein kinase, partial [Acidimicrobiales bacterium]|nr:serine/threonine protein kinase [Acidimicrobiales bacterium]